MTGVPGPASSPLHTGIHLGKSDSRISFAAKLQQKKNVQIVFSVVLKICFSEFNWSRSAQDGRSCLSQAKCISLSLKIINFVVKL